MCAGSYECDVSYAAGSLPCHTRAAPQVKSRTTARTPEQHQAGFALHIVFSPAQAPRGALLESRYATSYTPLNLQSQGSTSRLQCMRSCRLDYTSRCPVQCDIRCDTGCLASRLIANQNLETSSSPLETSCERLRLSRRGISPSLAVSVYAVYAVSSPDTNRRYTRPRRSFLGTIAGCGPPLPPFLLEEEKRLAIDRRRHC